MASSKLTGRACVCLITDRVSFRYDIIPVPLRDSNFVYMTPKSTNRNEIIAVVAPDKDVIIIIIIIIIIIVIIIVLQVTNGNGECCELL